MTHKLKLLEEKEESRDQKILELQTRLEEQTEELNQYDEYCEELNS